MNKNKMLEKNDVPRNWSGKGVGYIVNNEHDQKKPEIQTKTKSRTQKILLYCKPKEDAVEIMIKTSDYEKGVDLKKGYVHQK